MTTNLIDLAQTLAVDGINATRVRTPESRPRNQYDKCRDYTLTFAVAGAENSREKYTEDGKHNYNAVVVEVQHNSHRKQYRATAKAVIVHEHGVTEVFGIAGPGAAQIDLLHPVPAGRYSRKGLDALATTAFYDLRVNGFPRDNAALADLWDTIVESHGVARPALIPAGA